MKKHGFEDTVMDHLQWILQKNMDLDTMVQKNYIKTFKFNIRRI